MMSNVHEPYMAQNPTKGKPPISYVIELRQELKELKKRVEALEANQ